MDKNFAQFFLVLASLILATKNGELSCHTRQGQALSQTHVAEGRGKLLDCNSLASKKKCKSWRKLHSSPYTSSQDAPMK